MPLYMDVHPGMGDATPDDVAAAHRRDLDIQDDFDVRFLSYWFNDDPTGKAFCLAEAPDEDSLVACHKAAHGLMPHEVIEVGAPTLAQFMGYTEVDENDRVMVEGRPDSGLRVVMFTDIEGSTAISTTQGDDVAMELVREHDRIVEDALETANGRIVKRTGDGILAALTSVLSAVKASIAIQQATTRLEGAREAKLALKIGMTVGEPVEQDEDIFGAAVNLAARICAHASGGQTLVSNTIRDLTIGKGINYQSMGTIGLKGFPDPVALYEVVSEAPAS